VLESVFAYGILVKQGELAERIPGRERLPRTRRLRSPRDFQRTRQRGRSVSGAYLTLHYVRQAADPAPARAGFSVGKRVGNAVTRNRVKRRLREAIRRLLADVPPGWDLILAGKPGAAQTEYAALAGEVRKLLARAGLLPTAHANTPDAR
jgi:ribonuclease P protein component